MNYRYDIFISYSHKDFEVAESICKALSDAGISCFFDNISIENPDFWDVLAKGIKKAITDSLLFAAIPEELAKLFMLWLLLRKNPFFDEHFDGIVYAVCIGLGFAALENCVLSLRRHR